MTIEDTIKEVMRRVFPLAGTPAAELTEREKLTLARAAGAAVELFFEDSKVRLRTLQPVVITDDGDGKYIVAIGPKE